jgi:hypothetical protein
MKKFLIIFAFFVCNISFAYAAPNILILPLPSTGEAVYVKINNEFQIRAVPDPDGWEIGVIASPPRDFPINLLYHSNQWHGPYPTQIYAWHLLENHFPNTRWLCVSGQPIEVKLEIKNAKVKAEGESAIFVVSSPLHKGVWPLDAYY